MTAARNSRSIGTAGHRAVPLDAFLVARGLLDRALASSDNTAPGSMASVVMVDLAVETGSKATLASLGNPSEFPGRGYATPKGELQKPPNRDERLATILDRLLAHHRLISGDDAAELVGRKGAVRLREFRNGVQHDGNVPSADDVNRSRFRAVDFLDGILDCFFDSQLQQVSRASLIRDVDLARLVRQAEDAANRGDLDEAAQALAAAFDLARQAFRSGEPRERRLRTSPRSVGRAVGELSASGRPPGSVKTKLQRFLKDRGGMTSSEADSVVKRIFPTNGTRQGHQAARIVEDLAREIDRLSDRVEAFSAAGDPSEFAWFRRRLPRAHVSRFGDELKWSSHPPDPPLDLGEFLRALDFVVATALRWQEDPPDAEGADEEEDTGEDDGE